LELKLFFALIEKKKDIGEKEKEKGGYGLERNFSTLVSVDNTRYSNVLTL